MKGVVFIREMDRIPNGYALYCRDLARRGSWACPAPLAPIMRTFCRLRDLYWRWAWSEVEQTFVPIALHRKLMNNARHDAWKRGFSEGEGYWRARVFYDWYQRDVEAVGLERARAMAPPETRVVPKPPVNPWIWLFAETPLNGPSPTALNESLSGPQKEMPPSIEERMK